MKRKGIIFDLDGVLVSTDKLNYKAWKQVVDGINVSKVIKNKSGKYYFNEKIATM